MNYYVQAPAECKRVRFQRYGEEVSAKDLLAEGKLPFFSAGSYCGTDRAVQQIGDSWTSGLLPDRDNQSERFAYLPPIFKRGLKDKKHA